MYPRENRDSGIFDVGAAGLLLYTLEQRPPRVLCAIRARRTHFHRFNESAMSRTSSCKSRRNPSHILVRRAFGASLAAVVAGGACHAQ